MAEKVGQNALLAVFDRSVHRVDVLKHGAVFRGNLGEFIEDEDDGVEDARHLRVLVDEHEGVGDVVIAKVDNAAPDPATQFPLTPSNNRAHSSADVPRALHALHSLSRVLQAVPIPLAQHIGVRHVPQLEHIV